MTNIRRFSTLVITIVIFLLSLFPLVNNYKYNDHSKNWLNHDYGKNLLSSTEEYSVFMTEGGDNQVFSSLYFTYAEKLRQDLFPYDQKGNIFKRIYGDLRYTTYELLELRRPIVDKGLFTGQEPFYKDIRGQEPPYLVPYALKKPATYLTWKLPNQHKLGDFYYKNYGIMNKVQHIRYAIVDYLEPINSTSVNTLKSHTEETLGRNVSSEEWNLWLRQLSADGYITISGNKASFVKTYPKPFDKDPKDSFILRWDEIPNLQYYDYLSREIVNSYAYDQISVLGNEIETLVAFKKSENNKSTLLELQKQIDQKWEQVLYFQSLLDKTAFDSIGVLHNLGIFYLSAQERFDLEQSYTDKAIEIWEKAVQTSPYSWNTYNILLWAYMQQIFKNNGNNADVYLNKFDDYLDKIHQASRHWRSMKDFEKSQPYKTIAGLITLRQTVNSLTGPSFERIKEEALKSVSTKDEDISSILVYFQSTINKLSFYQDEKEIQQFLTAWEDAWENKKNNAKFIDWHFQTIGELVSFIDISGTALVKNTLKDGISIIHTLSLQEQFNAALKLMVLAHKTKDLFYTQQYKSLALNIAKKNLPKEKYEQLKKQLAQQYEN